MCQSYFKKKFQKFHRNLIENGNDDKLLTHFDLYHTLVDILKISIGESIEIIDENSEHGPKSLLTSVISKNRSCHMAQIPDQFCPCFEGVEIIQPNQNEQILNAVAKALQNIQLMALKLVHGEKCSNLTLKSIHLARRSQHLLTVVFQVDQRGAIFEAIFQINNDGKDANGEDVNLTTLNGGIQRIDRYELTSECVNGYARIFCICPVPH